MRKLVFIVLYYLFSQNLNAQTFSVGNTCCNYNLVNKTFTTSFSACTYPPTDSYGFDIDGDLVMDISINSSNSPPCFSGGATSRHIAALSFSGTEIVYTTLPTGCPYNKIIQKMNFGDILKSTLNWSLTPTSWSAFQPAPWIYHYSWTGSGSWTCGQQIINHYVAFRKILPSNDTIYGWVNVNSNFPGQVIDYAYTCGSYTSAPQSSTISTASSVTCSGDSVLLSGTPSGGVFYGTGVSGNYFKSKYLTAGTYTVNYAIPNPSGCTTSPSTQTITVNACVGINELGGRENNFSIFPNPNNGEFEIKGIKEETIFISNELGQQVRTVELNSENSFGTKISDLQSGIYFVGNKFYEQKVVVIK